MNDDHLKLVQHLFAAATALIEAAHHTAVAGQSVEIVAEDYAEAAHKLQTTARNIAVLAEAAMIVANSGINQGQVPRNHHR